MRYTSHCWIFAVSAQCVPLVVPQAHPRPKPVERCLVTIFCGLGKAHRTLHYRPAQNCLEIAECIGDITHTLGLLGTAAAQKSFLHTEELFVGHSLRATPAASLTGIYGERKPPVGHVNN